MRSLIEFIINNKHWFAFFFLEVLSLFLLFNLNSYQGSAFFTSANGFVGGVYESTSSVTCFFDLKKLNRRLEAENQILREEIIALEKQGAKHQIDRVKGYKTLSADVVKISMHRANNLLTINKGEADGISTEMGVVCSSGVIGIVCKTSAHYALVMPLVNVHSMVSCRLANTNFFGTMQWKSGNLEMSYVTGVPRHADVKVGGKIETNGYSDIFPPGIPIGEVQSIEDSSDGLSYMLNVKLFTDFTCLRDVSVITDYHHSERRLLEQAADSLQKIE